VSVIDTLSSERLLKGKTQGFTNFANYHNGTLMREVCNFMLMTLQFLSPDCAIDKLYGRFLLFLVTR
jgi:hypothetical protein